MGHRFERQHGKETLELPKEGRWGVGPSLQFELSHLPKAQPEKTNEMTEVTALLKLRNLYLQRGLQ